MNSYQEKTAKNTRDSVANAIIQQQSAAPVFQFEDNRPEAVAQLKIKEELEAISSSNPIQQKKNTTGLPDQLKSGIENLSGHSMDDVKVHYNSSKPAQLNAHAYAQGSNIQQKQGRVQPTKQLKQKVNINDDVGLEKEADVMGAKAMQLRSKSTTYTKQSSNHQSKEVLQLFSYRRKAPIEGITMRVKIVNGGGKLTIVDETVTDKEVGHLGGYIGYEIDKDSNEIILDHFEAHPAGAGLGTLLMFELAHLALSGGFELIAVNAPAYTAMGAYKHFGGVPRNAEAHEDLKGAYLNQMQENPEKHKDFVEGEANENAEAAVGKAKYFNPNLSKLAEGNTFIGTRGDHRIKHSGPGDMERVADLKALSSQLVYHPKVLNQKTLISLDKKWVFS